MACDPLTPLRKGGIHPTNLSLCICALNPDRVVAKGVMVG